MKKFLHLSVIIVMFLFLVSCLSMICYMIYLIIFDQEEETLDNYWTWTIIQTEIKELWK